jgi:hypothetical protein
MMQKAVRANKEKHVFNFILASWAYYNLLTKLKSKRKAVRTISHGKLSDKFVNDVPSEIRNLESMIDDCMNPIRGDAKGLFGNTQDLKSIVV